MYLVKNKLDHLMPNGAIVYLVPLVGFHSD